tara:strand:- start:4246 stop:5442 length:1197 start_codon:yes stop_codon:yes gene_type:complete
MRAKPYLYFYKTIYLSFLISFLIFPSKPKLLEKFDDYRKYGMIEKNLSLSKVAKGINFGWGMTFIDDHSLLITEKSGGILKVNTITGNKTRIKHNLYSSKLGKNPFSNGQGGLLDILFHNGFVYISYSHFSKKKSLGNRNVIYGSTAIARGKLVGNEIIELQNLFISSPPLKINKHWGSRIVIKNDYLYATFGDRGLGMIAQDPSKHPGSIIRINLDGTYPNDNPKFKENKKWLPEIYQIGFRNPQGLTISPHDNNIYFSQHGPRGGDNLGKIVYGGNLGWKEIAWGGTEYYGKKIGEVPFKDKFDKPILSWVPSIGIGQIGFYEGQTFDEWNGDLICTASKYGLLIKLDYEQNKIVKKEVLIKNDIGRIRDFEIDKKGDIFIIIDERDAALWKLSNK